jgi:dipeptidyl aminopeptidase/acylaminoacyl peptidase
VRSANSTDTLTAVSLDRPSPSADETLELLAYQSGSEDVLSPSNLLRAQFSPDGHRLVLSVVTGSDTSTHAGLVIVDVVAGVVTPLASEGHYNDVMPAWRPNGEQIAFVRSTKGIVPARNV